MILVTGAAGKTGLAVLRALARRDEATRALVYRSAYVGPARAAGAQDVIVGDMREEKLLATAVRGVRAIYHVAPNMHPDEVQMGAIALRAAQSAGLERFAYHSVLHTQTESMPHHWNKLRVEEMLFESGLSFTILQPAAYMQNIAGNWETIAAQGVYRVPYPAATRLSLVDLADVAEVAAKILTESGHAAATYELVGTPPLSQSEVAQTLSRVLGRPVRAEEIPLDAWQEQAEAAGLSPYAVQTLRQMFRYYAAHGFAGNPNVLAWLLGRPPTSLADFLGSLR